MSKEILGKYLFFDPRLSGSNIISCASCHNPSFAWGDSLAKGVGHGHRVLTRRTPTILNLAWAERFFWDGRAASLEEQALGPIGAEGEMNLPIKGLGKKIRDITEYRTLFESAYPGEPIDERTIAKALATYERTIVSKDAPFDHFVQGQDSAISESAKRGFILFNEKAKCAECHSGFAFTDHSFYDIGVADSDLGRGKFLKFSSMQHAFKTPTLRNVDRRAPYMHDGSEPNLESVIEFYHQGGKAQRPGQSPLIVPLKLSPGERMDLLSFLKTLTSPIGPVEFPELPR